MTQAGDANDLHHLSGFSHQIANRARNSIQIKFAPMANKSDSNRRFTASNALLQARTLNKAKNLFIKAVHDATDSGPPTPGLWDPQKESRLAYILKKGLKSRKDAQLIHSEIQTFGFYNQFIKNNMTEFGEEGVLQLCRQMKYEFIKKGNYVIREGDASNDKFYIILSGKASVSFKKEVNVYAKQNIEEMKQATDEKRPQDVKSPVSKVGPIEGFSQVIPSLINVPSADLSPGPATTKGRGKLMSIVSQNSFGTLIMDNETVNELPPPSSEKKASDQGVKVKNRNGQRTQTMPTQSTNFIRKFLGEDNKAGAETAELDLNEHGTVNKVLEQGDAFGEKALTNPDAKRTASIYTMTDCEFIIVEKKDFLSIVGRFNKTNRRKIEFLMETMPHLDKVNSRLILEDYMYSVHITKTQKGTKLTEQSKPGQRLFLISQGFCNLLKEVDNPHSVVKSEEDVLVKQKTLVQIARVGPGTVIGEELLFGDKKERKYLYTTIVDTMDALIYYMKATDLQLKFPRDTIQGLKQNFEQKQEFHKQRIDFVLDQIKPNKDYLQNAKSPSVKENLTNFSQVARKKIMSQPNEVFSNETVAGEKAKLQLINMRTEVLPYSRNLLSLQMEAGKKNNPTVEEFYEELKKPRTKFTRSKQSNSLTELELFFAKSKNDCQDKHLEPESKAQVSDENRQEERETREHKGQSSTNHMKKRTMILPKETPQLHKSDSMNPINFQQGYELTKRDSQKQNVENNGSSPIMNKSLKADTRGPIVGKLDLEKLCAMETPRAEGSHRHKTTVRLRTVKNEELKANFSLYSGFATNRDATKTGPLELAANSNVQTARNLGDKSHRSQHSMHSTSKRFFIIRQKPNPFLEEDIINNNKEDVAKTLQTTKHEEMHAKLGVGQGQEEKFVFTEDKRFQTALDLRRKAILKKMIFKSKNLASESPENQSQKKNRNAATMLTVLKTIVPSENDELYSKLIGALSQNLKDKQHIEEKQLQISLRDLDTPIQINTYESSGTKTSRFSSQAKHPLVESKTSYSSCVSPLSFRGVPLDDVESIHLVSSRDLSSKQENRMHSGPKPSKTGSELSLQIKKKMYHALRAQKNKSTGKMLVSKEDNPASRTLTSLGFLDSRTTFNNHNHA